MELEFKFKSLKRNKTASFDDLSSNIFIDAYNSLPSLAKWLAFVNELSSVFKSRCNPFSCFQSIKFK